MEVRLSRLWFEFGRPPVRWPGAGDTPEGVEFGTETHAGLISGPHPSWPVDIKGNLTIEASLHTEKQLRRQNAPNPWEVGWLLWTTSTKRISIT